ncbi:acyl-CoA desaturase [Saccharopolyspora terrae]|uniref:Acyl-CoA desaturase n=1 Tax=Saccharopolyspora terrae TaxID=2530384 RepID=A0A4R4VVH1_9PSEU|nr:acyl-CoA desaturase [Saccharopolyspora terrae]TDD10069.1 acyl-CoA desaturase [Saccharopolyspora terrae]
MNSDAVPAAGGPRRPGSGNVPQTAGEPGGAGSGRGSDFSELVRLVKQRGLLDLRRTYYAAKMAGNGVMLAVGAVMFVVLGDSWWQVFTAAVLAGVFTQLAFVGHDAGHRQIFRSRRANDLVGLIHGCMTGISYGWWVGKHRLHHNNPNHEDADPDLEIPALAFSAEQSRTKRGVFRWMAKYQAFLFFPLLLLEGFLLHVHSIRAVVKREVKANGVEAALLAAHVVAYLAVVFLVLSPVKALVFIAVHQGLWGVYMGCAFAPNHKGMPTLSAGQKLDYLRKQVLTSRNVRGGRFVDFLLGGLNYQIEHHLFPSMPRPNLRHAQQLVNHFCTSRGVSYSQCGLFRSYALVLRHLHAVGAPLRHPSTSQQC